MKAAPLFGVNERFMRKVNTNQLEPVGWTSPKGTFAGTGIQVSEALGRKRDSTDLFERHPLDVEILRVPPAKAPHQFFNDGTDDLVIYVVADNPIGQAWYYPDSNKWGVPLPDRRFMRSLPLDYFDGEE